MNTKALCSHSRCVQKTALHVGFSEAHLLFWSFLVIIWLQELFSTLEILWIMSCLILWGPLDCRPPAFSVHGIFQAGILQWVAISSSRGSSWPRDQTHVSVSPAVAGRFLTCSAAWEAHNNDPPHLNFSLPVCFFQFFREFQLTDFISLDPSLMHHS